jgi:hypothetical protein
MSVNCQQLVDALLDFFGGELSAEQRRHIEDHLCKCPPCVRIVETYRLTITVTAKLTYKPLPSAFAERLRKLLGCDDQA